MTAPCPDCGGAVERIDRNTVVCECWPGCPYFDSPARHNMRAALADLRAALTRVPPWTWAERAVRWMHERMTRR